MPAAQGSIVQQGKSPNLTIIAPFTDSEGRHRQKWQTVKRLPDETDAQLRRRAEQELQELIVKLRRSEPVVQGRLTLVDFITNEWLPAVRLQVTERTGKGYEAIMSRHVLPALGHKQLKNVTTMDLERLYAKMAAKGLSGNTRLHVHRVIHMALTDAVRRGRLATNPASRERIRAPRKETFTIQPPTPKEVAQLVEAASDTPIGVLVRLLALTGLRLGEALGLRWQDVDLDAGLLYVRQVRKQRETALFGLPKTERSRRVVDLAPGLIDALREHKNRQFAFNLEHGLVPSHDLVFTVVGRQGIEGMGHEQVARIWQDIRRKAGVPRVRIHDLRHFAATTMLDAGVPLPNVSEILGHGQTSTTANIYAHAVRSRSAAAVAEIEKALQGG
jgi:integrase